MRILPEPCPECSGSPVHHKVTYLSVLFEHLSLPLLALKRPSSPPFRDFKARMFCMLCKALSKLGVGELRNEPDEKTLLLDVVLWEEAARRGIVMQEFRLLGAVPNTFLATVASGRVLDFDGVPRLSKRAVWWINSKSLLKKNLLQNDLPAPRGKSVATLQAAETLFVALKKPLVVKPRVGSASRHTTMHVETIEELKRAFKVAKQVSPFVMIEEELLGDVYRATVVGGKYLATIRRERPQVVGDGIHTVGELITETNKHPKRAGPYFSPLPPSSSVSVPELGEKVYLHQKINWSLGGTTTDVTDIVHPDNAALFEQVAEMLHAPLVGIDFIVEDISRSWKEQKCGVIECNDLPYFDNHHLPFEGKPRDIAGPVWDMILEDLAK